MKVLNLLPAENLKEVWNPIFRGILTINANEIREAAPKQVSGYSPLGFPFDILNMELRGMAYINILNKKLCVGLVEGYAENTPIRAVDPKQPFQINFKIIVERQDYLDSIALLKLDRKIDEEKVIELSFDDLMLIVHYFRSQQPPREGLIVKRSHLKTKIRLVDWLTPLTLIEGYRAVLISNSTYQKIQELAKRLNIPSQFTIDDILTRIIGIIEESKIHE